MQPVEDGLAKVILLLREDLKKNGVLHAIFNAMSAVVRISGHLRTSQDISGHLRTSQDISGGDRQTGRSRENSLSVFLDSHQTEAPKAKQTQFLSQIPVLVTAMMSCHDILSSVPVQNLTAPSAPREACRFPAEDLFIFLLSVSFFWFIVYMFFFGGLHHFYHQDP